MECEFCGHAINDVATQIEWLGSAQEINEIGGERAVRFVEQRRCSYCGEIGWQGRQGTGYWSQQSWGAEADADRLVYDDDQPVLAQQ